MPIVTAAQRAERRPPASDTAGARPILLAAGFAGAELLLGVTLARFFEWERAEALLFFAFRPWLCLAGAMLASRWAWRARIGCYGLALLLAAAAETLLVLQLGASSPWQEAARGLAAGALLFALCDGLLQLGRKVWGRKGVWAAAVLLVLALLIPGALRPYDAIILERGEQAAAAKPDLMLMTGLPIIWGEGGAFDADSRPAAAYAMLRREYSVRPLDLLDEAGLASGRLLLLAQPGALAPAELVALDAWVRRGGKALILTDPMLVWPSGLPLGDVRRPPAIGLLGPLLEHWGLRLEDPGSRAVLRETLPLGGRTRLLAMAAPGRFAVVGQDCNILQRPYLARCAIGEGEALLIADADLMHDAAWTGPGSGGDARHRRSADNPLILADLLDRLSGLRRERVEGEVAWAKPVSSRAAAVSIALLPLFAAAGFAAWRARR